MTENTFFTLLLAAITTAHSGCLIWVVMDRSRFMALPVVNAIVAACVLVFWMYRVITVGPAAMDSRVYLLCLFESSLIVLCVLGFNYKSTLLNVVNSLGFGIHFVFFVLALILFLTWKPKMM
ncbi:MAG: hypothetical protein WCT04_00350 [Planctomycetota bacterium]